MASNQVGARLVFENAKNFVASQGYDVSQAVLTQSYVRSEVAMSATAATYQLPIVTNSSLPTFNTARPVQLQDVHVVSELGIFVASPNSSTATNYSLYSYANKTAFTSATALALTTLWNGYFSLTVNNQAVVPAIDCYRSYFVPQQQQNTNFNVASPTSPAQFAIDQNDGNSFGFTAIEPNILLNGAANIQAQIVLPSAISSVDANNRIVVIFRTILCQNVTSVK
jgi:hypothetical protein